MKKTKMIQIIQIISLISLSFSLSANEKQYEKDIKHIKSLPVKILRSGPLKSNISMIVEMTVIRNKENIKNSLFVELEEWRRNNEE
jgi:hypothetical protein